MLLLIILTTFGCLALIVISVYLKLAQPTGVVNARLESMDPSLTLVENNPVTAGLAASADDWPWSSAAFRKRQRA